MAQTTTTRSNGEQPSNQTNMENKSAKTNMEKVKPSYKHIPHSQKPPHLVAKRNARERRRVQAVNQAFYKLRKSVPIENRNKRVSKVKTLQRAIDYIRKLERILEEDANEQPSGSTTTTTTTTSTRGESNCQSREQVNGESNARASMQSVVQDELVTNSEDRRSRQNAANGRPQTSESQTTIRKVPARNRKQQAQLNGKSKQLDGTPPSQTEQQQQQQQINQVARVQQPRTQQDTARIGMSAMAPPRQEDNNYSICMKSTTTMAPDSAPFDGGPSNPAFVSYAKSNGRNVGLSPTACHQHFSSGPNHYGQYYIESPTSSSQLMVESLSSQQSQQYAYNHHHPQLPPNSLQGCEISSSSLITNGPHYGSYLQGGYQPYGALDGERTAALSLDTSQQQQQQQPHDQHQRLVNHNSYNKPVESAATMRTSNGQQRFQQLAPVVSARHYQDSTRDSPLGGQIEQGSKAAQAKMMLLLENANLVGGAQHTQDDKLVGTYEKQHGLETAISMPADSTSSVAMKDRPDKRGAVSMSGAHSPPASFCSSSPTTSMSSSTTTIKSLDLSGSGGGGSNSGAIFNGVNVNSSDKSPTTSANTPVVCRQRKSANESGDAHSTTGRGGSLMWRQANANTTDGQQQVNNYNGSELPNYVAAHSLYEGPSSNSTTANYSRANQNQLRQPDGRRTIKLAECKSLAIGNANASSLATNNFELLQARHRSGSRSSSTISPDPTTQQLVLVGGDYLANNNLHGNDQHSGQLFQHHPANYNYQQNEHYHQIQNHNSHHRNPGQQQQQPLYQGQHFLGNLQSGHQQLDSNHLNDQNNHHHHHHHHHLQSDSFPSGLRQPSANTLELATASSIIPHQQLERLVAGGSTASITAQPTQYTVQPL